MRMTRVSPESCLLGECTVCWNDETCRLTLTLLADAVSVSSSIETTRQDTLSGSTKANTLVDPWVQDVSLLFQ